MSANPLRKYWLRAAHAHDLSIGSQLDDRRAVTDGGIMVLVQGQQNSRTCDASESNLGNQRARARAPCGSAEVSRSASSPGQGICGGKWSAARVFRDFARRREG